MEKPRCPTCYWFNEGFCFYERPQAQLAQMQSMMGGPPQPQAVSYSPPVSQNHFCHHHSELQDKHVGRTFDAERPGLQS